MIVDWRYLDLPQYDPYMIACVKNGPEIFISNLSNYFADSPMRQYKRGEWELNLNAIMKTVMFMSNVTKNLHMHVENFSLFSYAPKCIMKIYTAPDAGIAQPVYKSNIVLTTKFYEEFSNSDYKYKGDLFKVYLCHWFNLHKNSRRTLRLFKSERDADYARKAMEDDLKFSNIVNSGHFKDETNLLVEMGLIEGEWDDDTFKVKRIH